MWRRDKKRKHMHTHWCLWAAGLIIHFSSVTKLSPLVVITITAGFSSSSENDKCSHELKPGSCCHLVATSIEAKYVSHLARSLSLLRCWKKEGSQMSCSSWQTCLQECPGSASFTCRALRGGHMTWPWQKSWGHNMMLNNRSAKRRKKEKGKKT